ncbi:MAG: bifunctional adenosylcobinamide kinase/adenosylcobinamide-phosphate guanylyltransferase [Planctomycetota bacterium]
MGKFIFLTGGVRSGKSRFAVNMAKKISGDVTFIATCIPKDKEMKVRVEKHKKDRPAAWKTVEEEKDIASVLQSLGGKDAVAIVDCLTLLISNLLISGSSEREIINKIKEIVEATKQSTHTVIIVSNEVGCGIVPDSELGRKFRDITGSANQLVAAGASEVYFTVSGIPIKIKGDD